MCRFLTSKTVDSASLSSSVSLNIRLVLKYLPGGKTNKVDWRTNTNVIADLVALWQQKRDWQLKASIKTNDKHEKTWDCDKKARENDSMVLSAENTSRLVSAGKRREKYCLQNHAWWEMFPEVTEVITVWSPRRTKKYFYTVIYRDSPWDAFSAACTGYLLNIPAAKVTTLFKSCLPPLGSISILSSLSSSSSSITAYRWRLLPRPRLLKKRHHRVSSLITTQTRTTRKILRRKNTNYM